MAKLGKQEKVIVNSLTKVVNRFAFLDDLDVMIGTNNKDYRKALSTYKKQIESVLFNRYLNRKIVNLVVTADKSFIKTVQSLIDRNLLKTPGSVRRLIKPILDRFKLDLETQINTLIGKQLGKKATASAMAQTFKLSKLDLQNMDKRRKIVEIEQPTGEKIQIMQTDVDTIEAGLDVQFGNHSTLKYNSGANGGTGTNYPLVSHVENLTTTIEADVERSVMLVRSAELGVYTVKVSTHHGKYSCALHEGEIVFISENSKRQFQREFPQFAKLTSSMRTLEELRADPTRIFKFNCSHTYRPFPMQFFDESDIETDIKDNPIKATPNLPESKLMELVV